MTLTPEDMGIYCKLLVHAKFAQNLSVLPNIRAPLEIKDCRIGPAGIYA